MLYTSFLKQHYHYMYLAHKHHFGNRAHPSLTALFNCFFTLNDYLLAHVASLTLVAAILKCLYMHIQVTVHLHFRIINLSGQMAVHFQFPKIQKCSIYAADIEMTFPCIIMINIRSRTAIHIILSGGF